MADRFKSAIGATTMIAAAAVDKDGAMRANFEHAFARYEGQMQSATDSVLRAHPARSYAVHQEILDLFVARTVSLIRNPYSIAKVIDTFGPDRVSVLRSRRVRTSCSALILLARLHPLCVFGLRGDVRAGPTRTFTAVPKSRAEVGTGSLYVRPLAVLGCL
jgi:hypothetical protein